MVNIHFLVTDFASHRTWIQGYQRYLHSSESGATRITNDASRLNGIHHDIRITLVPGDRWKFRMMAASADLLEQIHMDDELLVVDAMLDVTVLVALLKSSRPAHQCPLVFLYFHENQLTTPFTAQDRDLHKPHPTHWHYGMAHWRSLLVADGCIFNSHTHRDAFYQALPKCLNEQCPRDTVEWHLTKCQELLSTKCGVLPYGLDLDELLLLLDDVDTKSDTPHRNNVWVDPINNQRIPVILWNARLEEDKNPAAFVTLLDEITKALVPFRLIILGTDPSKGQKWYQVLQEMFGNCILHMGWCQDRSEYAHWLSQASVVVSTANHETFGISVVESVHCGALPLLPKRLSYPEIFQELQDVEDRYFYKEVIQDGVEKLIRLLQIVATDQNAHNQLRNSAQHATKKYRWPVMGTVYDQFFAHLAKGNSIVDAENQAKLLSQSLATRGLDGCAAECDLSHEATNHPVVIPITDPNDTRTQLFRPKSLRDHRGCNEQLSELRSRGIQPALHGGRRAMVRMLEAIGFGANIQPISFLTTPELSSTVLLPAVERSNRALVSINGATNDMPPIYTADKDLLDTIRGQKVNSGDAILAMVQFPMESPLDELLAHPPIVVLENVRNAENVGSILRTAFCLGIRSVVASSTAWAALKDSRAARCSMGTMYYHRYFQAVESSTCNTKGSSEGETLVDTIQRIRSSGIRVYGIEIGDNAKPIAPHGRALNWAAVMGNEDLGLSHTVAVSCDQIVYIPQAAGDSLNVGHAAAIAMFELGREGPKVEHDGLAACT
ncbi:group 1 glycosyl transferase [Nitzschia inconspicua]|uniref:tRNA-queuosine alpha-mannosyltransferase n=1 Tax=Nitzschia inconspicua TaxID=303405 RepID=A0A9K3KFU8_9STRA|nr:group 1 glycosyl transferase [Nitzschia inconspicua]KAG7342770.1 group 1 glycosyl transferase [Nitzschia inconspicua]